MNLDINRARKSYQYNPLISNNDKDNLSALLDEVVRCRKNPLAKMQGCKKWVRENDINQQLEHLKSEVAEFEKEKNFDKAVLEWWDIGQNWLTGMMILKIKYNVDIDKLVKDGQAKNAARLYDI